MGQQNDLQGVAAAAVASEVLPADRTPDDVAIFAAPSLEVVLHWWAESKRRWAEANRQNPLMANPVALHDRPHAFALDSE